MNTGTLNMGAIDNIGMMLIDLRGGSGATQATLPSGRVGSITNLDGRLGLIGNGIASSGDVKIEALAVGAITTNYQAQGPGVMTVMSNNFTLSLDKDAKLDIKGSILGLTPGGGLSLSDRLTINTNKAKIGGNINGGNGLITISAQDYINSIQDKPSGPSYDPLDPKWSPFLSLDVGGSIFGGTNFISVGRMNVAGDYHFSNRSVLDVMATPDANLDGFSFWADVKKDAGGNVTIDTTDAIAIVSVGGQFVTNLTAVPGSNQPRQIGVTIFDTIAPEDDSIALWLLYAEKGVLNNGFLSRELSVMLCNATGTRCFDYMTAAGNSTQAYIREDAVNGKDYNNALFVVFDHSLGGPIRLNSNRFQPPVRTVTTDDSVIWSANSIDNFAAGSVRRAKFIGANLPIDALIAANKDTIFEGLSNAIYDRMETFATSGGGTKGAADYERLSYAWVPTEAGQFANLVTNAERMVQSSLQKRMMDESLWRRNRVRTKFWIDGEYSLLNMNNIDGDKDITGDMTSVMAGYDVQISQDTIFGITGGLTMGNLKESQALDLSYGSNVIMGGRDAMVNTTMINIGGYMLSKMGESSTFYASGGLYSHTLNIDKTFDMGVKNQNIGSISGDGNSSSFGGEIGVIHAISGQYLTGNLSARFLQSNGFSFTETINGEEFMNIKQEGYTVFAPGYSLMAQRRMYLHPSFIMRPYLSVGAEYQVMAMGEMIQYKYASADLWSEYRTDVDPLWVTAKGGFEFLSISGLQFGIGLAYHYNSMISVQSVNFGTSMRF